MRTIKNVVAVKKDVTFALSSVTFRFLEPQRPNPHRSLRMEGVSRKCNNALLQ